MLDIATLDKDLCNLIDELPSIITIDGRDVLCARGDVDKSHESGDMGVMLDYDVNVIVQYSRLAKYPLTTRARVRLDGEDHFVTRSTLSADGVQVRIYLKREAPHSVAI